MKQYLDLMREVWDRGVKQETRTGVNSYMIPGAMLKFNMADGFPAVTTKKLAFNAVKGELLGFLRGVNTVSGFNELGCKVWDANAAAPAWQDNPNCSGPDDLGRIYGQQWRKWKRSDLKMEGPKYLDQIENLIIEIKTNPSSRRLLVTAWRPDEIKSMALPPCHYGFQVIIEQESRTLHLLWNQR